MRFSRQVWWQGAIAALCLDRCASRREIREFVKAFGEHAAAAFRDLLRMNWRCPSGENPARSSPRLLVNGSVCTDGRALWKLEKWRWGFALLHAYSHMKRASRFLLLPALAGIQLFAQDLTVKGNLTVNDTLFVPTLRVGAFPCLNIHQISCIITGVGTAGSNALTVDSRG